MKRATITQKLRQQGWDDYHAGKAIDSRSVGGERNRAHYEIGWRSARDGEPRPYSSDVKK